MKTEDLTSEFKALKEENAFLKEQIKQLKKMIFGAKSERFVDNPDALYLPGLEPGKDEIPVEDIISVPAHEKRKAKSTPLNKITYPDELPVETTVIDLKEEEKVDTATGAPLVRIGEEVTKRLAVKPSQFFVKQIIRFKYAVQSNPDEGIKIAELPDTILNRPACDESLIADVVVKKFCDHLPLYRQSEMFTRQKIYISRQTLSGYVNKMGEALIPLYSLMQEAVFASGNIFVDETPVDELAPGKGKTNQGYVVTVAGGQSLDPPNRTYIYFPDRKHANFNKLLNGYKGVLHSDKYGAYEQLAARKSLTWCPCWAHIRRKFIDAEGADPSLKAANLKLIQQIFKIEEEAALLSELERVELRKAKAEPIIDELLKQATEQITKVLPKSKIREALGYLLNLKPYLKNYMIHPMARLDNNVAERALRPVAIGRKNWLFVGNEASGQNTAILLSFAQTCRALKINPHEYFEDVFRRIQSHRFNKLYELLPENWKKTRSPASV